MEQRCKSNPSNLQHKPSSYKNDGVEICVYKIDIFIYMFDIIPALT